VAAARSQWALIHPTMSWMRIESENENAILAAIDVDFVGFTSSFVGYIAILSA
jgi:hypothetical protein